MVWPRSFVCSLCSEGANGHAHHTSFVSGQSSILRPINNYEFWNSRVKSYFLFLGSLSGSPRFFALLCSCWASRGCLLRLSGSGFGGCFVGASGLVSWGFPLGSLLRASFGSGSLGFLFLVRLLLEISCFVLDPCWAFLVSCWILVGSLLFLFVLSLLFQCDCMHVRLCNW